MLKKSKRLTKNQFSKYFKTGRKHHSTHLTIVYTEHTNLHASVVVSKKVSKRAVDRNTIRRRVYAEIRNSLVRNNQTGVFIILVKPSLSTLSRKEANQEVAAAIAAVVKRK